MVTIELTNYQARKLKAVLKAELKDYEEGISALELIDTLRPTVRIGASGILPEEAIHETRAVCSVMKAVIEQLKEED